MAFLTQARFFYFLYLPFFFFFFFLDIFIIPEKPRPQALRMGALGSISGQYDDDSDSD